MPLATFKITSAIWMYQGASGWHFITLPKQYAEKIKAANKHKTKAWGSLPVTVTLNDAKWKTSLFPDKKSASYLLPLKSEIRKKLDLHAGDNVTFILRV